MATYDTAINRAESDDPLIPAPVSAQVIQDMPRASAVLSLARRVPMSTKSQRQPILSALPEAYFVTGDSGLKQTTIAQWENKTLVAEELAALVVIPDAYFDDSQIPLWDEVRPLVVEALGRKIDLATLYGFQKPTTWDDAIVPEAIAAGNEVDEGATDDLASDVALVAQKVAEDGFGVNGFISAAGFRWRLVGLRSTDGIPIYAPPAGDQPGTLYGFPVREQLNGGFDAVGSTLIAGDWTKAVVGMRQDITFRIFDQGIINDDDGNVVYNAMQQDGKVLRVVMRLGWAVANPVTAVNPNDATRYPFGVLTPAGGS